MNSSPNPLMEIKIYKNKKQAAFIVNSKLSEIKNLSSLFNFYSNDKNYDMYYKYVQNSKKKKIKTEKTSKKSLKKRINSSKIDNKSESLRYLFKNKSSKILSKEFNTKRNILLRNLILEKERRKVINLKKNYKNNISNDNKHNKENNENSNINRINLILNLNIETNRSINNTYTSNFSNIDTNRTGNITGNNNNISNKNKKPLKKKKIKLSKRLIKVNGVYTNIYNIKSNKDLFSRYNSLENIIQSKKLEFEHSHKKNKKNQFLDGLYNKINQFKRKMKSSYPLSQERRRVNTESNDKKKNIPYIYNNYLNKNKNVFNELNKVYQEIKNDINYDIDLDKISNNKKKVMTEEEIKQELYNNEIKKTKRDIGYIKPSDELFIEKSAITQLINSASDHINNISSKIAYRHRYYLGKKYGFDPKKDLLKINVDPNSDDYQIKRKLHKQLI